MGKNRCKLLQRIRFIIATVSGITMVGLLSGCVGPVENDIDYCELESVWQYLKTYCIYQWKDSTRVPDDPFAFEFADEMMAAVGDTLYGDRYTHYTMASSAGTRNINANVRKTSSGLSTIEVEHLDHPKAIRISIYSFEYGVTYREFMRISREAVDYDTIIIDLRKNGGGDIDETDSIIEAMLPAGVAYLQARNREYSDEHRTARTVEWHTLKTEKTQFAEFRGKTFFVEMNHYTASASEILIAALVEGAKTEFIESTTLIGTTTYGKGIGQIKIVRRDRPELQITFLQMRGVSSRIGDYHRKGIEPDVSSLQNLLGYTDSYLETNPETAGITVSSFYIPPSPVAGYRTIFE